MMSIVFMPGLRHIVEILLVMAFMQMFQVVIFGTLVQHHQVVGDNLGGVLLVVVLVFPGAGSESALNINEAALAQILLGQLGKAAPQNDGVPFGLLDLFTGPVLVSFSSRQ